VSGLDRAGTPSTPGDTLSRSRGLLKGTIQEDLTKLVSALQQALTRLYEEDL